MNLTTRICKVHMISYIFYLFKIYLSQYEDENKYYFILLNQCSTGQQTSILLSSHGTTQRLFIWDQFKIDSLIAFNFDFSVIL